MEYNYHPSDFDGDIIATISPRHAGRVFFERTNEYHTRIQDLKQLQNGYVTMPRHIGEEFVHALENMLYGRTVGFVKKGDGNQENHNLRYYYDESLYQPLEVMWNDDISQRYVTSEQFIAFGEMVSLIYEWRRKNHRQIGECSIMVCRWIKLSFNDDDVIRILGITIKLENLCKENPFYQGMTLNTIFLDLTRMIYYIPRI